MFNPIDCNTLPSLPSRRPKPPPVWSSDHVLAMDVTELADACSVDGQDFRYFLTDAEMGWLRWIGDRYEVACVLYSHLVTTEDPETGEDRYFVTLDYVLIDRIAEALRDEGLDRAPCLSEDTALQRIVWCIGPAEEYEEERV